LNSDFYVCYYSFFFLMCFILQVTFVELGQNWRERKQKRKGYKWLFTWMKDKVWAKTHLKTFNKEALIQRPQRWSANYEIMAAIWPNARSESYKMKKLGQTSGITYHLLAFSLGAVFLIKIHSFSFLLSFMATMHS